MRPFLRKTTAVFIAAVQLTSAVSAAPEGDFWSSRRRAVDARKSPQLASLTPSAAGPRTGSAILSQLPSVGTALGTRAAVPAPRLDVGWAPGRDVVASIPATAATVQEVFDGGAGRRPPVLLIQDIHLNAEAQTNMSEALRRLIEDGRLSAVAVEGAFAPFDFAPFRASALREVAARAAGSYLAAGQLAAPSHAGITSVAEPPVFAGVDDRAHYDANVRAYLASRAALAPVQERLARAGSRLAADKARAFSPDLLRLDGLRAEHHAGRLELGAYVRQLARVAPAEAPVLRRFTEAYALERELDFARVDRERRVVIERLTRALTEAELKELLDRSLAYRLGRVGYAEYYRGLEALCVRKGVTLSEAPAFRRYLRYVILADGIRVDELMAAVARLETTAFAALTRTEDERRLAALSERAHLTGKLVRFELTPPEWEAYAGGAEGAAAWAAYVNADGTPPDLAPFEAFYREADERSRVMTDRLLALDGRAARALVLGGFHTPQVAARLRAARVPFVVVTPRITKVEGDASGYLTVFAREKTPLEKLFAQPRLTLSPEGANVSSPVMATRLLGGALARAQGTPDVTVELDGRGVPVHVEMPDPADASKDVVTPRGAAWRAFTAFVRRMLAAFARPRPAAATPALGGHGGLIGKFQVLTKPVHDAEASAIRFRGRHVDTGEETDIELSVRPARAEAVDAIWDAFSFAWDNPVAQAVGAWLLGEHRPDRVLIILPNPHGIRGIGAEGIVAVEESVADNFVAVFHEAAEAMGASGILRVEDILATLKPDARAWYEQQIARDGRAGLALHYAIRALQREQFADDDRQLTRAVRGLPTARMLRDRAEAAGVRNMPRLLQAFVQRQSDATDPAGSNDLFDALIRNELALERDEDAEAERQVLAQRRRVDDALEAGQIIGELRSLFGTAGDAPDQRRAAAEALVDRLNRLDPEIAADVVADAILAAPRGGGLFSIAMTGQEVLFLVGQGAQRFSPALGAGVVARLFTLAMSPGAPASRRAEILRSMSLLFSNIASLDPESAGVLLRAIRPIIRRSLRSQPSVSQFSLNRRYDITDADMEFFDVDPENEARLYLKPDFKDLISDIRDRRRRTGLEAIRREAEADQKVVKGIIDRLVALAPQETFEAFRSDLDVAGISASPRLAAALIERFSFHRDDPAARPSDISPALIAAIGNFLDGVRDPALRDTVLGSLAVMMQGMGPDLLARVRLLMDRVTPGFVDGIAENVRAVEAVDARIKAEGRSPALAAERGRLNRAINRDMKTLGALLGSEGRALQEAFAGNAPGGAEAMARFVAAATSLADGAPDMSVRTEAAAVLQRLADGGGGAAAKWLALRLTPADADSTPLVRALGPLSTPAEALVFLRGPPVGIRAALAVVARHQDDAEFLKSVVYDANLDIRLRLSAFTHFSASFLVFESPATPGDQTPAPALFDELQYQSMIRALAPEAEAFLRATAADIGGVDALFGGAVGADEEYKAIVGAVMAVMSTRFGMMGAKGAAATAPLIRGGRLVQNYHTADAAFHFGERLYRGMELGPGNFILVIAHEMMHDVLIEQVGYRPDSLTSSTIHEMLADTASMAMADILGLPTGPFMRMLSYEEHLATVQGDADTTIEEHEGGRAQLELVRRAHAAAGRRLDPVEFLATASAVLADSSVRDLSVAATVEALISRHFGLPEAARSTGADRTAMSLYRMMERSSFDVDEEGLFQRLLGMSRLGELIAQAPAVAAAANGGTGGIIRILRRAVLAVFPSLSPRVYDRVVGPILENGLVLLVQGVLMLMGVDAFSSAVWSWGLFALIHFVEYFAQLAQWAMNGRAGSMPPLPVNALLSLVIGAAGVGLVAALPFASFLSAPALAYALVITVVHIVVNTVAGRAAERRARERGAELLAGLVTALANRDAAALTRAMPLGVARIGSAALDDEAALMARMTEWLGRDDFRALLAAELARRNGGALSEARATELAELAGAVLMARGVALPSASPDARPASQGAQRRLYLFRGASTDAGAAGLRRIGLMTSLLRAGEGDTATLVVDDAARPEIEAAVAALTRAGLLAPGLVRITSDPALMGRPKADLAYINTRYANPSLVVMPGDMRPADAPAYVVAFEDLLGPVVKVDVGAMVAALRAALVAA